MKATVLDLARVEPFARVHINRSPEAGRIGFVAGDFFTEALPAGDLYALGRIIHDWGEPQIMGLLGKIYHALPPGGALLVAETLLEEDKAGPIHALMQDLNMLVCTDGRERSFTEYRELLEGAGFSNVEYRRTGSVLDAVLASK